MCFCRFNRGNYKLGHIPNYNPACNERNINKEKDICSYEGIKTKSLCLSPLNPQGEPHSTSCRVVQKTCRRLYPEPVWLLLQIGI